MSISKLAVVAAMPVMVAALVSLPASVMAQGRGRGSGATPTVAAPASHPVKPTVPPGQAKPTTTPSANAPTRAGGAAPKIMTPIVVKPGLAGRLQPLLPAGTTVNAAAEGFKNLGQFVAAVHVAHNLDIPFSTIKTEMVTNSRTLGQAIQTLKPAADATTTATHAERDADTEIAKFGK
jgi:hypothetical protein